MIITDIQRQKHSEKRFSVYIDGKYSFGVTDIDLLYYKLKIGESLSEEKYNEILYNNAYAKAKETALRFLGFRMRSRKEIYDRLKKDDFAEEITEGVIAFLEEYGYIDDKAFAKAYIDEKRRLKGYGGIRLKQELLCKGISREIIDGFSDELENDDIEIIKKAIDKKLKGRPPEDMKEKQRLFGHLIRKGFPYEKAKEALAEYIEELEAGEEYED
ncbi:MAG: RecX family transcriptional regulator [Clostridiales bacterium]|nr:RecX family transcriptional regulator [Clostridiales bacterium]